MRRGIFVAKKPKKSSLEKDRTQSRRNMGPFRSVIQAGAQPSVDEYLHFHSGERHRRDILLFLLLSWNTERISLSRLREIWGFFLHGLRKKSVEVDGFYKNIVTGQYRGLEKAISFLLQFGFAELRSRSVDDLFFYATPRDRQALREAAPQRLLDAIDEVGPVVLRVFRREITEREGLSLLRSLREKNREPIPA